MNHPGTPHEALMSAGLERLLRKTSALTLAAAWLLSLPQLEAQASPSRQDAEPAQPVSRHDDPYFEETRPLTAVSRQGREFLNAFNAAVQRPRIVALLSPVDPLARQEAVRLAQRLQAEPDSPTAVFALWIASDAEDSLASALRATGLLSDSRVVHFHDLHGFVLRSLTARLDEVEEGAAVVLVHYPAGALWLDLAPLPADVRVPPVADQ